MPTPRSERIRQALPDVSRDGVAKAAAGLLKISNNMLLHLGEGGKSTSVTPTSIQPPAPQQPERNTAMGNGTLPWMRQDPPFGPGVPLTTAPINPNGPEGHVEPRTWQYPVTWNMQTTLQRTVPFALLRQAADVDFVRRCIEIRKNDITSLNWSITFKDTAIQQVLDSGGASSKGEAVRILRTEFAPQMAVYRRFWERPNRRNDETFSVWLGKLLEEYLVIDALSIYPARTWGGQPVLEGIDSNVHSLRILDGSTIKPLLDDLGDRPNPPYPAYQQVLHGFPRGDFTALDPEAVDYEMRATDLIYTPRNRSTDSPFGNSPVEQCLPFIDLWLNREQWLRAEYSDGATPNTWLMPDAGSASETWTPAQRLAYEIALNNDLVGQTAERHRLKLLPPGLTPEQMDEISEKYSGDYDAWLITSLGSFFDVLPTQLGIQPRRSSGVAQEGEQTKVEKQARLPTVEWLVDTLNEISNRWLGMPYELTFKFTSGDEEDLKEIAESRKSAILSGQVTLNDLQAEAGRPLYDFDEADMPFVVAGNTVNFLDGLHKAQQDQADAAKAIAEAKLQEPAQPSDSTDAQGGDAKAAAKPKPTDDSTSRADKPDLIKAESATFLRYATKRHGKPWRAFAFSEIDRNTAAELNSAGRDGDLDLIKSVLADLEQKELTS